MSSETSKKVKIHPVTIRPEEWTTVPTDERHLLVALGHILNELNILNRLMLTFQQAGNRLLDNRIDSDAWQCELNANAVQTLLATMTLAGKLCEAAKFMKVNLFDKTFFPDYKKRLSNKSKQSLDDYLTEAPKTHDEAKRHPLTLIRDLAGFHYDNSFLKDTCSDENLNRDFKFYLADNNGNTLYWGSTEAVLHTLMERIAPNEPEKAMVTIVGETIDTASRFKDFLHEFLGLAFEKYFVNKFENARNNFFEIKEVADLNNIRFPFFTYSTRKPKGD